ncbi:ferredoxin [Amycolatopsis thermoflava]|uniref:ferredoxin n=1 Tax=Amycolatopsis thermoflava TaxID=84480 RepID=UPI0036534269
MNQPFAPLTPQQQWQILAQAGQVLAGAVPPGWRQMRAEYRAAGRHVEVDVAVVGPDGVARPVPPPPPVVQLLGRLRAGMYQPGRGTWLAAVVVFDPGRPPQVDYVIDHEPRWRQVPPPIGFADELRFFPRAEEFVPAWLRERAQPRSEVDTLMRSPRVYDGLDSDGRPIVRREPLAPEERARVLAYLEAAPVVLAARSYAVDEFAPEEPPSVPLNFRTDGHWVWPGAVTHYLREHGVPPDPELVAHIRARGYVVPEVGEQARDRAVAAVT